jgi:hypothetical protein
MTAGRIDRELWWTDQEFSPFDIIPSWFSMLVYHLRMNNRPVVAVVQRCNFTPHT